MLFIEGYWYGSLYEWWMLVLSLVYVEMNISMNPKDLELILLFMEIQTRLDVLKETVLSLTSYSND